MSVKAKKEEAKKEEASLQPASPLANNDESPDSSLPARRVKLSLEVISQDEIDRVNAIHERMVRNVGKIAKDAVLAGKILAGIKLRLTHGRWNSWVEANLHFTVRTAVRYMNAYQNRESLLEVGPEVFLRTLWGHEPKKLKASFKTESEERDEQSGGEGFGAGLGEPTIFADKGKPGFYGYKNLVSMLDHDFFGSKAVAREEKLKFITELTKYLENQRKKLES